MDAVAKLRSAHLYLLLTAKLCRHDPIETTRLALKGGVDVVQLREKDLDDDAFAERARQLAATVEGAGAVFLLNDRIDVAARIRCDGVHVGQDDMPVQQARGRLPPGAIVGLSTHDEKQARAGIRLGADYLGFGPVFPTTTKDTGLAPREVRATAAITRLASVPVFAIGGVSTENAGRLAGAGVSRIAVSSAILTAPDPERAAWELKRILTTARRT